MKGKQKRRPGAATSRGGRGAEPQPRQARLALLVVAVAVIGVVLWMLLPVAAGGRTADTVPETAAPVAGPPPVHFAPEQLDLGEVETDLTVTRRVDLVNTSDRGLRVRSVRGNCSCVRASAGAEGVIQPRGRLPVTVEFDTLSNPSLKNVRITIVIDGFEEPISLPVRAQIVRAAE